VDELFNFSTSNKFFDQHPLLNKFLLHHFNNLCRHNVDVERIFATLQAENKEENKDFTIRR